MAFFLELRACSKSNVVLADILQCFRCKFRSENLTWSLQIIGCKAAIEAGPNVL